MKQSFLKTFIVLGLFTIFVFGNVGVISAEVRNSEQTNIQNTEVDKTEFGTLSAGGDGTGFNWDYNQGYGANIWNNTLGYGWNDLGATLGNTASKVASGPIGWVANESAKLVVIPLVQTGAAWALQLAGIVVYIAGGIFDTILRYTIVDQGLMNSLTDSIGSAWKIIRDLANIVIVFSLLYLGIKTILNGNGFAETKVLISILVAAVLINFSLIITQTVFNISNVIGSQIGQQITFSGAANGVQSISEGLMGMIRPDNVVNNLKTERIGSTWQDMWDKVQSALFTGAALFFMIIIFTGASIMLLYRFLIFIVLMITSPVGLTSSFIPWFEKIGESWWKALKTQAIVLPAFLLTLYISILFVAPLSQRLNASAIGSVSGAMGSQAAVAQLVSFLFHYLLIIGFLLLPLIVPGKIGAAGADMMTNAADWTTKKLKNAPKRTLQRTAQFGAGTAARAGRFVGGGVIGSQLKRDGVKKWAQNNDKGLVGFAKRSIGQAAIRSGEGLQNATYDLRNIDAIGKSDFGKGMGKGVEGWNKSVEAKKKKIDERRKSEMKLFGFDKIHETKENKIATQQAEIARDAESTKLDTAKNRLKDAHENNLGKAIIDIRQQAVINQEKELEKRELIVGQFKSRGEYEYTKQLQGRLVGGWSPKITTKAGFYSSADDLLKKWKKDGQSNQKKKQKATDKWVDSSLDDKNPGSPPPPDTPPATPPATT